MGGQNLLYSEVLDMWYKKHRLRIAESTAYNYRKAIPTLKGYFKNVYVQNHVIYRIVVYVPIAYCKA